MYPEGNRVKGKLWGTRIGGEARHLQNMLSVVVYAWALSQGFHNTMEYNSDTTPMK